MALAHFKVLLIWRLKKMPPLAPLGRLLRTMLSALCSIL